MQRAVLVLTSVHGLRPGAIRSLTLEDVDLSGKQLHLAAGLRQPLGPISVEALAAWLGERRRRWPLTANPHLFLTDVSALTTSPVSAPTLRQLIAGTGVTLDRIRRDRFLEETLAHGPDPLHLTVIFGTCSTTAMDYVEHAKQLYPPPSPQVRSRPHLTNAYARNSQRVDPMRPERRTVEEHSTKQ